MYKISEKNTNGLFSAIADGDIELSAAYIKDIYMEIFDNTQALNGDELDTWTAQVDVSSEEGTDGINAELDKLYDFCDAHGISLEADSKLSITEDADDSKSSEGWGELLQEESVLYDLESFIYELRNTTRGAYTNAYTYKELAAYIHNLANRLRDFGTEVSYMSDEDMEESLVEKELSTKNRAVVNETLTDSQIDRLLDKAFSYGYSYGYSGDKAFDDFLSRVKVPLEDEEKNRLRAAFDNGNRQAEYDEERSYYGESCAECTSEDTPVGSENNDVEDGIDETLNERELSRKERSISKVLVDNKDKINATSSKEELVSVVRDLLKDVNPERTEKIFRALNSKRDYFKALQYIYDFILKGDDLGVIKEDVETEDDIVVDMFDDFNFDDDIDELIKETRVEECDCGFVPDDTDNIELVDVEEDIERPKEVVYVDACTPDRFKSANPVNFSECKAHNLGPGEVDMDVDGFIPDDTDDIELK